MPTDPVGNIIVKKPTPAEPAHVDPTLLSNLDKFSVATKPKHLRIPPELEYIAIELLGSSAKPYTSDNEINALVAANLTYDVEHYFTSPSA